MSERFPSRFKVPEDSAGFLLWQVSNAWQRQQRAALEKVGLTHVQFVLLASVAWLNHRGEPVSQVRLSQHAKTDVMTTSQVVRALEKRGLLRRDADRRDSRAKSITVTAQGKRLVARAFPLVESVNEAFFDPLGDQIRGLKSGLLTLIRADDRSASESAR
jgi:DNA-binding MarR family transcriptional regulator